RRCRVGRPGPVGTEHAGECGDDEHEAGGECDALHLDVLRRWVASGDTPPAPAGVTAQPRPGYTPWPKRFRAEAIASRTPPGPGDGRAATLSAAVVPAANVPSRTRAPHCSRGVPHRHPPPPAVLR